MLKMWKNSATHARISLCGNVRVSLIPWLSLHPWELSLAKSWLCYMAPTWHFSHERIIRSTAFAAPFILGA